TPSNFALLRSSWTSCNRLLVCAVSPSSRDKSVTVLARLPSDVRSKTCMPASSITPPGFLNRELQLCLSFQLVGAPQWPPLVAAFFVDCRRLRQQWLRNRHISRLRQAGQHRRLEHQAARFRRIAPVFEAAVQGCFSNAQRLGCGWNIAIAEAHSPRQGLLFHLFQREYFVAGMQ